MCCPSRRSLLCAAAAAAAAALLPFAARVEYRVHKEGCVLVTGASSGIGRAAALRLLRDGFTVYAGVRRDADAAALRGAAGGGAAAARLHPLLLDVARPAEVEAAAEAVRGCGLPFVALVNNAGVSMKKPVETLPLADLRWVFDVNLFGLVDLTQRLTPLLRSSRGRIINVGSIAGVVTAPFMGAYSASKYALEAVSDALRLELAPWGVSVSMVNPGYVTTEIRTKARAQVANASATERELYGETFDRLVAKEQRLLDIGSPCCDCTDDAIAHAVEDPYPMTRYYPAVVAPGVPAGAMVPVVKLLSLHPHLDRVADLLKSRF